MKLIDSDQLYFPKDEWQWLRQSTSNITAQPDFFLWGVCVPSVAATQKTLWVWHPLGHAIEGNLKCSVLQIENVADELSAFGLYLKTTFAMRQPQDSEWVSALKVLKERFQYQIEETGLPPFWYETLEQCGLSSHSGALLAKQRYTFLTHEELSFIYKRKWDVSTFDMIETWDTKTREIFLDCISKWNLSAQIVKEASNYIYILLKKFGTPTTHQLLNQEHKTGDEFRIKLFHTAQPELARLSQIRLEKLRNLKPPPRSSVFGDPSFESDQIKITHQPKNMSDFEVFKSWIEDPSVYQRIKELLEIYQ